MKSLISNSIVRRILAILIYPIVLIGGTYLFCFVPFNSDLTTMNEKASELASAIEQGDVNYADYMYGSVRIVILDSEQNPVSLIFPGKFMSPYEPDSSTAELVSLFKQKCSKVFDGQPVKKFVVSTVTGSIAFHQVTAVPVYHGGTEDGAIIMYKMNSSILYILIIFVTAVTICYILCMIITYMSRQRKLHDAQLSFVKGRYVANITHELKTPITNIRSLASALYDDVVEDPGKQKQYVYRIIQESKRQEHLVQGILELSKIQSNSLAINKHHTVLSECFGGVIEKYTELSELTDTRFHAEGLPGRNDEVYTDPDRISEIIDIIVDNAFKFAVNGDIWIAAENSAHEKNKIIISIKDNGIGISEEELPLIFERFYKNKSELNEHGSGLGLAIVKELTAALDENVRAESTLGEGTTFYLTVTKSR